MTDEARENSGHSQRNVVLVYGIVTHLSVGCEKERLGKEKVSACIRQILRKL